MKRLLKSLGLACVISLTTGTAITNQVFAQNNESHSLINQPVEIDGAVGKLKAVLQTPVLNAGEKCPIVILMHGIFSNKEFPMITKIADELQENGIASIRFDFNAHGESEGEFIDMTVPLEVKDALAVYQYCKSLGYTSDIHLLGHSQGGAVASLVGGELKNAVKSIVLLAPAGLIEEHTKKGTMLGTQFDPDNLPEYIFVFNQKVGYDYLATAQKLNIYENAAKYKGPVCLVHGKADMIVPYSYSEKYNEIYTNSILHLIEGEGHSFERDMNSAIHIAVDFLEEVAEK